jgi:hypothetical protein
MNARMRTLLWSEWRQRRAQFVVSMLWLNIGIVYCIIYELAAGLRSPVGGFFSTTLLFAIAMPIFIAMRTSLGELTDRTRAFHDGLPVATGTRATVRLIGGLAVLVVPIISAGIILSFCLASGWVEQALERTGDYWNTTLRLTDRPSLSALAAIAMVWRVAAIAAASATMLYLILSLLGMRLRCESHLGFAGAAVAALWFLGMGWATPQPDNTGLGVRAMKGIPWVGAVLPQSLIINYGYQTEQGNYGDLVFASRLAGPLLVNLVIQLGLASLFVRRYGRRISRHAIGERRRTVPKVWRRWTIPLGTPGIALAWLTLRQSVPMCIPGLVIAFLMAPLQMDATTFNSDTSIVRKVTDILPSSMWVVGLLWSIVVGAGTFAPELDSRIAEFWRAWPTATWRLFSVKFLIGLAAVLLVLDGTTIAVSWNSPNWGHYYFMNWPYIACIVPLHATMFAVAVAWTCLLRRPVVGGMAAFATFMLFMIAMDWSNTTRQFSPIEVYDKLNEMNRNLSAVPSSIDFATHNYPAMAAAMALLIFTAALTGWWALRSYSPRRAAA